MTTLATWLYADPEGSESRYSQVEGRSSSADFQAVYWRCVVLFFATSVRHNPDARHLLYTNVSVPPPSGTSTRLPSWTGWA